MNAGLRWRPLSAACLAAVACAACGVAGAEVLRFSGTAHDVKTGRVLYREQYEVNVDNGHWQSGTTRYVAPDGSPIGERRFDFSQDRYVPVYAFDQIEPAYHEGITKIDRSKVEPFLVRDGERKTASLDRVKEMVADCGAQAYVIDHLDALAAGQTLRFTLVVAGRVDAFRLRASKARDADVDGRRAMVVKVELDSMLSLVLPTLELTIDPATKRLVQYQGIANVKDPATRRSYTARIVYAYP